MGAQILSLEKERLNVNLERALMAVRVTDEFVGTQFHPETYLESMRYYFRRREQKDLYISKYGREKYFTALKELEQPSGILLTQKTVLPNFLKNAIEKLRAKSD